MSVKSPASNDISSRSCFILTIRGGVSEFLLPTSEFASVLQGDIRLLDDCGSDTNTGNRGDWNTKKPMNKKTGEKRDVWAKGYDICSSTTIIWYMTINTTEELWEASNAVSGVLLLRLLVTQCNNTGHRNLLTADEASLSVCIVESNALGIDRFGVDNGFVWL